MSRRASERDVRWTLGTELSLPDGSPSMTVRKGVMCDLDESVKGSPLKVSVDCLRQRGFEEDQWLRVCIQLAWCVLKLPAPVGGRQAARTRLSRYIACTRYAQLGTVTCSLGA